MCLRIKFCNHQQPGRTIMLKLWYSTFESLAIVINDLSLGKYTVNIVFIVTLKLFTRKCNELLKSALFCNPFILLKAKHEYLRLRVISLPWLGFKKWARPVQNCRGTVQVYDKCFNSSRVNSWIFEKLQFYKCPKSWQAMKLAEITRLRQ
jgi:hypothetical protein